jgi:FkbM family methyltransferase
MTSDGGTDPLAQAIHWTMRRAATREDAPSVSMPEGAAAMTRHNQVAAPSDLQRFVSNAYQLVLGRAADPSGLQHQLTFLTDGGTRGGVLEGLARSAEGAAARHDGLSTGRRAALFRRAGPETARAARTEAHLVELYGTVTENADLQGRHLRALESLVLHEGERSRDAIAEHSRELHAAVASLATTVDEGRQSVLTLIEHAQRALTELMQLRDVAPRPVLSTGQITVVELEGFLVGVPAAEWRLASYLATRGNLEPGLTARFRQVVAPGATVVDVGANIGMYTLHAARAVGAGGTVHSFEPTPAIHRLLSDNVQVNGFKEAGVVHLHAAALSDVEGEAELAVYADNNGHNSLFRKAPGDDVVTVPLHRLDAVLGHDARVDVVKIDVEGAELQVLRGMQVIASRNPGIVVFCELAPEHLERAGSTAPDFVKALADLGWQVQVVEEPSGEVRNMQSADLAAPSTNMQLVRS